MAISFTSDALDTSYGYASNLVTLYTYTNKSDTSVVINSVTLHLATADIDNFGTSGTLGGHYGNGNPIDVQLKIAIGNIISDVASVTVTAVASGPSGGYPDKSKCAAYTFTFNNSPIIETGQSATIDWINRSDLKDSSTSSGGDILTIGANGSIEMTTSYTVKWHKNDGSGTIVQTNVVMPGTTIFAPTLPSRTGYDCTGWYTASSGGNAVTSSELRITENKNFYAQWELKTYTVIYDANGGTGAPSSQTKTYGVDLTLMSGVPTRTGYIFKGWATTKTATSAKYQPGNTYKSNEALMLYAVWQLNSYTITYDANEGTVSDKSSTTHIVNHGSNAPNLTAVRAGHTFLGWYTSKTGSTEANLNNITSSFTVYAHWEVIVLNVTFYANGGMISGTSDTEKQVSVNYGETVTPPDVSYSGYTFSGWYTTSDGGSYVNLTTEAIKESDLKLYAHWELLPYVWRYNSSKDSNGNIIGWEKVLFVKKYNGSSWDNLTKVHKKNNGTWN